MRQSVWDGLWRPGGAFFQIGFGCVMSHHYIEGLCTFLFKFRRENSKRSSCQQLVLQKHALLETILSKFGLICATGNAFVRLIVGRNSILNFPAKIWTGMCRALLCSDDSSHSQSQSGKRLLLASRGHPIRTLLYHESCIDPTYQGFIATCTFSSIENSNFSEVDWSFMLLSRVMFSYGLEFENFNAITLF